MKKYHIDNLDCAECAPRIEERLRKRELSLIVISALLIGIGIIFSERLKTTPHSWGEYAVFLTAYLISGWRVLRNAGKGILRGKLFDEHFLMTTATIGAIIIHELSEAAAVMLFFHIGEFIQSVSLARSRRSIQRLLEIRPEIAWVQKGEGLVKQSPESVQTGELIVVKPGERIPLDGVVVHGTSFVDTSPLTGEPVPRSLNPDGEVLAGMINQTGVLTIRVTKRFDDSSLVKILYLAERAVEKKAKTERFITRFTRFYTPIVLVGALAVALAPPLITQTPFKPWIYRALVLLVISCPCALVVSIPLGYFGGIGKASRQGILIKGSNYLDLLPSVGTVIFDKTGTLTRGVFRVQRVIPKNGFSESEVLRWASEAESHSQHPIAQSIRDVYSAMTRLQSPEHSTGEISPEVMPHLSNSGTEKAAEKVPEKKGEGLFTIQEYEEMGGYGIRATIGERRVVVGNDRLLHLENIPHDLCSLPETFVHVAVDGTFAGTIVIGDELRGDAQRTVDELRKLGVKNIGMLTGDNHYTARNLAASLGLDYYFADLLPDGKVEKIEEIIGEQGEKHPIAFVGDGINDAPVIARADVGIAMGKEGSDAAIETADIVIMSDSPYKIVKSIELAKKTRKIVWQNIAAAVAIKGVFVILGSFGMATMWEAVFADMGVTILAIFNVMRILRG